MTPEAQRIAIAEACGWKFSHLDNGWSEVFDPSGMLMDSSKPLSLFHVPDFLNDLNAMHEAEKVLSAKQCDNYRNNLDRLCLSNHKTIVENRVWHATAAQRAEAFLRTLRTVERIICIQ